MIYFDLLLIENYIKFKKMLIKNII